MPYKHVRDMPSTPYVLAGEPTRDQVIAIDESRELQFIVNTWLEKLIELLDNLDHRTYVA